MSKIENAIQHWEFCRDRTLDTLNSLAELPNTDEALGWTPQPGRAHICWQLMHIAITEDIFATMFLENSEPTLGDLVGRFRKGSQADDQLHSLDEIKELLASSRVRLIEAIRKYEGKDLNVLTPGMQDREWTVEFLLNVISWHETHHQGQVHFCLNSYKASQKS